MKRSTRRSPRGWAFHALGPWLGVWFAIAFLAFGGVHASTRAVLHGMAAVACVLALGVPDALLQRAGASWRFALAGGLMLAAVGVGLVPVPATVLAVVAPGAPPAEGWRSLSQSIPHTVGEIAHLLLLYGAGLLAALYAQVAPRRSVVRQVGLVGAAGLLVVATVHAGTGTSQLFGVVPTWITPPKRFFAPFLNPNHLASALLLLWPMLGYVALNPSQSVLRRGIAGALTVGAVVTMIAAGSRGALGVVAIQGALMALWRWRASRLLSGVVGGGGALVVTALGWWDPGRLRMGQAAIDVFRGHWLAGSGGGTFDEASQAVRSDTQFEAWSHAHHDGMEWLAETGLVGCVALVAAALLLAGSPGRSDPRAAPLQLGALGGLLHACVDFPLQIPALGMGVAALGASGWVVYGPRERVAGSIVRSGLVALAVAQGLAGAWQVRTVVEDAAVATLRAQRSPPRRAFERLERWAPWHPALPLARARQLVAAGRADDAVEVALRVGRQHPASATTLRGVAQGMLSAGNLAQAKVFADAAVDRAPYDWRSRALRAEVLDRGQEPGAVEAWLDVVARGGPLTAVRRTWSRLPVGLPWVEAAVDQPARYLDRLGKTLVELGDVDGARVAYEYARQKEPHRLFATYVTLLEDAGEAEVGERRLVEALDREPNQRAHLRQLAGLRERAGRPGEAVPIWLRLASLEPAAQAGAVRTLAQSQGLGAARTYVARLARTRGPAGVHPLALLEEARQLLRAQQGSECISRLIESGLLDDARHGNVARRISEACRRVATTRLRPDQRGTSPRKPDQENP